MTIKFTYAISGRYPCEDTDESVNEFKMFVSSDGHFTAKSFTGLLDKIAAEIYERTDITLDPDSIVVTELCLVTSTQANMI